MYDAIQTLQTELRRLRHELNMEKGRRAPNRYNQADLDVKIKSHENAIKILAQHHYDTQNKLAQQEIKAGLDV